MPSETFRSVLILVLLLGLLLGFLLTRGSKSQWVRLGDVFIFGPILIWSGFIIPNKILAILLVLLGSSTMAYNLRNYFAQQNKPDE